MYVGLTLSGIFALMFKSPLISDEVGSFVYSCWAVGMMVSSGLSAWGSMTDRWLGEYVGLPLLSSVLALYGISAMLAATSRGFPILAYGLLILSCALGMLGRWRDVQAIKLHATQLGANKERE